MKKVLQLVTLCALLGHGASAQQLPVTIASLDSLKEVSEPQISPDGKWVSYSVSSVNFEKDYYQSDVWMVAWDGSENIQLTHTDEEDESTARWSPDNRYLSFLSSRKPRKDDDEEDETGSQLWLLNRQGGEAKQITSFHAGVDDYAWSPDGKKLALIISVKDTVKYMEGTETPVPIVIDRYYFKEDYSGYLGKERKHLYVMDVATGDTFRVVDGDYEEELPSWSPDGKQIAFVSKRARPDWDRDNNFDVWVAEAKPHAVPVQVSKSPGADADPSYASYPSWSVDGKWIAYFQGGPIKLIYYGTQRLAISRSDGSETRVLTQAYDRNIWHPQFSDDGKEIYFLSEDDQNLWLDKIPVTGGMPAHVIDGRYVVTEYSRSAGKMAVLYSTPDKPYEVYGLEAGGLRALTHQNDEWIQSHRIHPTVEITTKSKDGTAVRGHYVMPGNEQAGKKLPAILQIHGGPTSQNQNEFYADWQLYASWGYVLVSMNPRGSTGFGEKYATGIFAKWGTVDLEDDLSGVDYLVKNGIADPNRLAVEGWSYGGIATDFMIAKDHRFKCAVSGASIGNALAGFGTDMYIREYIEELGTPWDNYQNYVNNSYPFLHADKIKTPTLFMCGEKDFNVPLLNTEQMYQALKHTGVETQLIIYHDQFHGLDIPSYLRDRFERRKQWFDKYTK